MKKILALVLVLVMALSIVGCTSKPAVEDTPATDDKPVKIGVNLMSSDDFNVKLAGYYKAYAEQLGLEINILHSDHDAAKQLTDMETLIAWGADVIIFRSVDVDASIPAAQSAIDAGIPVVLDQTGLNDENAYTVKVSGDQIDVGKAIGGYIKEYLDANPDAVVNMGYIHGGTSETIVKRELGIYEVCPNSDRFKTLITANAAWSLETAMATTEDWLQAYPDMNVIACANDEMASGVVQALKAAGRLDDFMVFGVDGTEIGLTMLHDGEITATTYQSTQAIAEGCIDVALRILAGENVGKLIAANAPILVTKDNLDQVIADNNIQITF